ncbi:hypothetical protein ABZX65_26995 [Streptomyces sp. NPDC003300]|uniref:hypothetical protein n=1 Tax=unclassified Streptomyces TaxID=2593676 RepID=UPI0033AF61B7
MTTTPAARLTAAATHLRTLARAASTAPDGEPTAHWTTEQRQPDNPGSGSYLYGDHITRDDGRLITWPLLLCGGSPVRPAYMHTQHAVYAATLHPPVGLLIADLLDSAAEAVRRGSTADPAALALADAIPGGGQ